MPALRDLVPYALRVELARLRRLPAWLLEARALAPVRGAGTRDFPFVLAAQASPLRRAHVVDEALQRGKVQNVSTVAARLDGLRLDPGRTFSYHHAVGRPSRRRGFTDGLELQGGREARGLGGGACAVSNLIYLLALRGGLVVTERHRHALDLFPDDARRVPFGCGATVFYNYADLRVVNPLDAPVALRVWVDVAGGELRGELRAPADPGFRVALREEDHRFVLEGGAWWRENRVCRRITRAADGALLVDQEIARHRARCAYTPAQASAREAA